jgi:hypothetical protein
MLEELFSDRLWIYTGILGSLFGAASLHYFKDTKAGIWAYSKFDKTIDFLRDRWGWTWLDQPKGAWKKTYPEIAEQIDALEAHIVMLEDRIDKLEGNSNPWQK